MDTAGQGLSGIHDVEGAYEHNHQIHLKLMRTPYQSVLSEVYAADKVAKDQVPSSTIVGPFISG